MGTKTVIGADQREWQVKRNIEWSTPATGDEFEHDVDGGRGAALMILSSLFLMWVVVFAWKPAGVNVPWVYILVFILPGALVPAPALDDQRQDPGQLRGRAARRELDRDGPRDRQGPGGDARRRPQPEDAGHPGTRGQPAAARELGGPMPESPEIEALAHHLRENAVYRPVARVDVASMSAVKTFDPPVTSLVGRVVTGAARYGKFLSVEFADRPGEELHLVTHLSRAGWLRWHETASTTPPKPGRGPLEFRVHLDTVGGPGFDLTEAGTQKRLAVHLVRDPQEIPGVARLGPDALTLGRDQLAELLAGQGARLKTLLVDQKTIAGIGNAYSDEILHTAKLSPFAVAGRLPEEKIDALAVAMHAVLTDAVDRSVGQGAATLKGEKRSGLRVHARTGLPCPVCGDTVREVSFADRSFQYCPTCQTGGKPLADRRLSRLVR
jgi:formamidopyrimidine-DNA glycosylase